ncbi:hypothetical protein [Actinoplanes xinjiangensis]|uniref:hypothetical protein n=1 Tax=Actinoplanes xinjiangensis TaxID=512350 RepID=UPI0034151916
MLYIGIGREDLPPELGFGSGMTWRRWLERWTDAEVFDPVHRILLAKLNAANRIDWSGAAMDGNHIDAKKGSAGERRAVPEADCRPRMHLQPNMEGPRWPKRPIQRLAAAVSPTAVTKS